MIRKLGKIADQLSENVYQKLKNWPKVIRWPIGLMLTVIGIISTIFPILPGSFLLIPGVMLVSPDLGLKLKNKIKQAGQKIYNSSSNN
ncbi:MAG: hypothetical protein OHK0017_08290 [Patescibacteria group bacterium]